MHQRQESHVVQRGREISVSEMEEMRETVATFWRLPRIHFRTLLDSGLPNAACLPFRAQDGCRNCMVERSALFPGNAALGAGLSRSSVTIFFGYLLATVFRAIGGPLACYSGAKWGQPRR